jgi:hypothetical protein
MIEAINLPRNLSHKEEETMEDQKQMVWPDKWSQKRRNYDVFCENIKYERKEPATSGSRQFSETKLYSTLWNTTKDLFSFRV